METKTIVLNTPSNLDFNEAFGKMVEGEANKHKLIFLIHQINYYSIRYKGYDLPHKAHYEMLGISPNRLKDFIGVLRDRKIIDLTVHYDSRLKRPNRYSMVKPFDVNNENESVKHFYTIQDKKCPTFLKKWVADGWKVCEKRYSKWTKPEKKTTGKKNTTNKQVQVQLDAALLLLQQHGIDTSLLNYINPPLACIDPSTSIKNEQEIHNNIETDTKEIKYQEETFIIKNFQLLESKQLSEEDLNGVLEEISGENGKKGFLYSCDLYFKKDNDRVNSIIRVSLSETSE